MDNFIYEYVSKSKCKDKFYTKNYNINSFIHGIALGYEDAIEKYKQAYSEVGIDNEYDCVIIKHNLNILSKENIDRSLNGIDLINEIDKYCNKIMYLLNGKTFELYRSYSYFSMEAYIIFINLNKEFYNKYKFFIKGTIIEDKITKKLYEIVKGSEDNELTLYNIWANESYSTTITIKDLNKGWIKTTDCINMYDVIYYKGSIIKHE